ncbi:MAG: hypothetical protein R3255_09970, partial [Candidatus Lokiarchaeia archaeon]|nr:hypothetical protein [Candidatus Lokiarchaeia archaeon]
ELNNIPIIVCYSGLHLESGVIHRKLRNIYLQNNPFFLRSYKILAEIAWKSRFAIMRHDWAKLGKFFKENTKIMNNIMKAAGFKYGIGVANNILIEILEKHPDVYAAKLTGAGGGGSIFALIRAEKAKTIINYCQNKLNELIKNMEIGSSKFPPDSLEIIKKLGNTQFYEIKIDKKGVKKL